MPGMRRAFYKRAVDTNFHEKMRQSWHFIKSFLLCATYLTFKEHRGISSFEYELGLLIQTRSGWPMDRGDSVLTPLCK